MKKFINQFVIYLAIASSIISASAILTKAQEQQPLLIGQNDDTQEITITGVSGGSDNSQGCGYLSKSPNQVIKLQEETNFMSLSVALDSLQGSSTLFIIGEETNTQFCAFQDDTTGISNISGLWPEDTYDIYVGDRNGDNYNFTLTINSSSDLIQ